MKRYTQVQWDVYGCQCRRSHAQDEGRSSGKRDRVGEAGGGLVGWCWIKGVENGVAK